MLNGNRQCRRRWFFKIYWKKFFNKPRFKKMSRSLFSFATFFYWHRRCIGMKEGENSWRRQKGWRHSNKKNMWGKNMAPTFSSSSVSKTRGKNIFSRVASQPRILSPRSLSFEGSDTVVCARLFSLSVRVCFATIEKVLILFHLAVVLSTIIYTVLINIFSKIIHPKHYTFYF